jgi:membrane-associated protein
MSLVQGLHGVIAIVLLCGLLFVEEAGVPLPIAPGELTLLAAGLLIAAGGLNPFAFVPLAIAACIAGALVGYSWARIVGERGLRTVAGKFRQSKNLERVSGRVRAGGARSIAISRSIIGLRIYTTLVAGAAGVSLRTFLLGMVPVTAAWVITYVVLGAVVGIPIERFFNSVEKLLAQGAILVAVGVGVFLAVRRAPGGERSVLMRVPYPVRVGVAIAIDTGIVASVVAGVLSGVRIAVGIHLIVDWVDAVVVVAMIALFYLIATRRGRGTVGETLLNAHYIRRFRVPTPMAMTNPAETGVFSDESLLPAAATLKALSDVSRLRIARVLVDGNRTLAQVAAAAGMQPEETLYHLAELEQSGIVRAEGGGEDRRYCLDDRVHTALLNLLPARTLAG